MGLPSSSSRNLRGQSGACAAGGRRHGYIAAYGDGWRYECAEMRDVHHIQQHIARFGFFGDCAVDGVVIRGGDGDKGVFQIAALILALTPGNLAVGG